MEIKELRTSTGLSQQKFSDKYHIPVRTIQDWESKRRIPPDYVVELLKYRIENEIPHEE